MKLWYMRSTYAASNPSADQPCQWEAAASELGFDGGGPADADPAPAAAEPADKGGDPDPDSDDSVQAAGDGGDADEPDEDADPLDLLTTRDDDPEENANARPIEDRYKALSKRARKLERSLKKSLPITQALREAGVDLRTLVSSHQRLSAMEAALQANPRLRALLDGGADDDDAPADRGRRGADRDDPVEYPFDINDPVGRFMSEFHKNSTSSMRQILDRLDGLEKGVNGRIGKIEAGTAQQQRSAVINTWKTTATAAAEKLEPGVRQMFMDAVLNAAHARIRGEHTLTPQQIIDHYLKPLKVSDGQKKRASDAAAQKTAQRNTNLPRRPGNGQGTPASPGARRVPRLEDFNRGLQRKMGA